MSRERLIVEGGGQLYVSGDALTRSTRGEMLMAGTQNLMYGRNKENKWYVMAKDSILGAVLSPSRQPRAVLSPLPLHRMAGVRAFARPDGSWSVVFAEVPAGDTLRNAVAGLWHGVLDGQTWRSLERLPLPPPEMGSPVLSRNSSRLVGSGDRLAWALAHRTADGAGAVIVYERLGGRWRYDIIRTGHAVPHLVYSGETGLVMALQQADLRLPSDGSSILLWVRRPDWRILHTAVPSSRAEVRRASFIDSPDGPVLTWTAEVADAGAPMHWEAQAMMGSLGEGVHPIMVVEPAIGLFGSVSFIPLSRGVNLWVSDNSPDGETPGDIRMIRDSAAIAVLLHRFPSPFALPFSATALGSSEVLITGGMVDDERSLFSLLIRLRVECSTIPS